MKDFLPTKPAWYNHETSTDGLCFPPDTEEAFSEFATASLYLLSFDYSVPVSVSVLVLGRLPTLIQLLICI